MRWSATAWRRLAMPGTTTSLSLAPGRIREARLFPAPLLAAIEVVLKRQLFAPCRSSSSHPSPQVKGSGELSSAADPSALTPTCQVGPFPRSAARLPRLTSCLLARALSFLVGPPFLRFRVAVVGRILSLYSTVCPTSAIVYRY
jgi:hypothetical protein